ncbi:MAG TPA: hypothetical protein VFF53_07230, partial [Geobacteraceae bacterium]|nr:hypothetical protein [Geobacteraceae bacterium]
MEKISSKIVQHGHANEGYLEEGVKLLELVQHAVSTYKMLDTSEKGSFLKIMHSNSCWRDGQLHHEYRKPFDFIAETNREYKLKRAVFRKKSGLCVLFESVRGFEIREDQGCDGVRIMLARLGSARSARCC